jgi:hypothetical protein
MKKFTLLEAQSRYYGGGNPFSNGHRSQNSGGFLLPRHVLIDLDKIYYDETGIKAIVEKKFKAESLKLGNILTDNTYQKQILLSVCRKLGADLYVEITSENKLYLITGTNTSFNVPQSDFEYEFIQSGKFEYNSDDVIFLEVRNNSPVAIVKRNDGIQMNHLLEIFSKSLNIKIIKVDDTKGYIDFWIRDTKDNYVGRVNNRYPGATSGIVNSSSLTNNTFSRVVLEWEFIYKKLGIY